MTSPRMASSLQSLSRGATQAQFRRDQSHLCPKTWQISGREVIGLMRRNKRTVSCVASQHFIDQAKVRTWRTQGGQGFEALNIVYCITGVWLA